jgi:hypothetical protein
MDIGALKRDDFEVWVRFADDAEVLIRYLSPEDLREIAKKATRISWDRKHRKVDEVDVMESNRLLGRTAVRNWKGITMEGKEFAYTPGNCDFLMQRWHEFSKFVGDACVDLQTLMEEERQQMEKNSSPTSGQG